MTVNAVVKVVTLAVLAAACGVEPLPSTTPGSTPRNATSTRPRVGPNTARLQGSLGPVRNMDLEATVTDLSPDGNNTVLLVSRGAAGAVLVELMTGFPTSDVRYQREGTYTFGADAARTNSFSQQIRVVARADSDGERDVNRMAYVAEAATGIMTISAGTTAGYRAVDLVLEFADETEPFTATFLLPGRALPAVAEGSAGTPEEPVTTTGMGTVSPTAWMRGAVGYVSGMDHQATAQADQFLGGAHITVTARDPNLGVTMSIISLFVPLTAEKLVPGSVFPMGAGLESFSVLGCSDRDSTQEPFGVEFDEPADDGSMIVDQGPTPDTRILRVHSTHLNGPNGRTDMTAQLTVQLQP